MEATVTDCRLTKWADGILEGPAYRFMFWPTTMANRRHWLVRLVSIPVQFVWGAPLIFLLVAPLLVLSLAGMVWEMTDEDEP
jgi:hypothetical protein